MTQISRTEFMWHAYINSLLQKKANRCGQGRIGNRLTQECPSNRGGSNGDQGREGRLEETNDLVGGVSGSTTGTARSHHPETNQWTPLQSSGLGGSSGCCCSCGGSGCGGCSSGGSGGCSGGGSTGAGLLHASSVPILAWTRSIHLIHCTAHEGCP